MEKYPVITEEKFAAACDAMRRGEPMHMAARLIGVSERGLKYRLNKAGGRAAQNISAPSNARKDLADEEIVAPLLAGAAPMTLAGRLGISLNSMSNCVRRLKQRGRLPADFLALNARATNDTRHDAAIQELTRKGVKAHDIADQLIVPEDFVQARAIKLAGVKGARPRKPVPVRVVYTPPCNSRMSEAQIAKLYAGRRYGAVVVAA